MPATARGLLFRKASSAPAAMPSVTASPPRPSLGLEGADDYRAFEAAIIADYDAQSAVEPELVLRLASLLWRLRRSTTIKTGLFEIQADHLRTFRQAREVRPDSRNIVHAIFGSSDPIDVGPDQELHSFTNQTDIAPGSGPEPFDPAADLARCFWRLATSVSSAP
jgi:hypothetical protein